MSDLQIFECLDQGTPEWLAARAGIPTASEFSALLVNGKGSYGLGAGAITYAHEVAGERIIGSPAPSFSTTATERGHEMEPKIRSDYEFMNDVVVKEIGFMRRGGVGYSPDGLVGENGLVEIKSHLPKKLITMLLDGGVPKEHRPQMATGLFVSEREWIDLVVGWDGLPPVTRRLYRDEKEMEKIADAADRFNAYVNEVIEKIMAGGIAA